RDFDFNFSRTRRNPSAGLEIHSFQGPSLGDLQAIGLRGRGAQGILRHYRTLPRLSGGRPRPSSHQSLPTAKDNLILSVRIGRENLLKKGVRLQRIQGRGEVHFHTLKFRMLEGDDATHAPERGRLQGNYSLFVDGLGPSGDQTETGGHRTD